MKKEKNKLGWLGIRQKGIVVLFSHSYSFFCLGKIEVNRKLTLIDLHVLFPKRFCAILTA